jgi:hypothetical protein
MVEIFDENVLRTKTPYEEKVDAGWLKVRTSYLTIRVR